MPDAEGANSNRRVTPALTEEVRRYIEQHLQSVEELDILRLLERERERCFTAAELASELRATPASVERRIEQLRGLDLAVAHENGFRLAPAGTKGEKTALEVLAAYRDLPVTVITLIFSKPSRAIQDFAQAFRLKKEEQDG